MNNWIVVVGQLLSVSSGDGGFEFHGPFETEVAAIKYRDHLRSLYPEDSGVLVLAVQLLRPMDGTETE